jgi:hypothetical protein
MRAGPLAELGIAEPVPDESAPGVRMHGKVFFTIPSGPEADDYTCSGPAVNAPNHRVVWTAGHCAYELDGGGYVTHWTFVPAYADGRAPFGEWPAKKLIVPRRYERSQDLRYDFGAAAVARNASGAGIQDVVGARGIAFGQPRSQHYVAYGYPVLDLFAGSRREYSCSSDEQGGDRAWNASPRPLAIRCNMTGGASGGGWIAPGGVLASNTSYSYGPTVPPMLYGPDLGDAAAGVYDEIARKRKPKRAHGGKGGKHKGGKHRRR